MLQAWPAPVRYFCCEVTRASIEARVSGATRAHAAAIYESHAMSPYHMPGNVEPTLLFTEPFVRVTRWENLNK